MMSGAMKDGISRHSRMPVKDITFQYGTAGFRTKGNLLDSVMFRMGCLAALRSRHQKGHAIGAMVTASHNPEEDNGVKLVDPEGQMLEQRWEAFATQLANCSDEELPSIISTLASAEGVDMTAKAIVFIGRDTRSTSASLGDAVKDGIEAVGGQVVDMGVVSTPQLHFGVRRYNSGLPSDEESYYVVFAEAFKKAVKGCTNVSERLILDGSNGVGALKAELLKKQLMGVLEFDVINAHGVLNYQVGADFVKTQQKIPQGVDSEKDKQKKFASLDGDADRLIYYYVDEGKGFHMLDGDKIATLIAAFIKEELNLIGDIGVPLKMGVVQTAYANGASTSYLKDTMNVNVACAATGVKHLHHLAEELFDIGVYFEANGHGTVLFKKDAVNKLKEVETKWQGDASIAVEKKEALQRVLNLPELINQAVGDALSDMLAVEAILLRKNWSIVDWDNMYQDRPNRLATQKVGDRSRFKTTDAERQLTEPIGLQDRINAEVKKFPNARSFVRPSGTEDVVRIYAEAENQEDCNTLSKVVCQLVADA